MGEERVLGRAGWLPNAEALLLLRLFGRILTVLLHQEGEALAELRRLHKDDKLPMLTAGLGIVAVAG